MIQRISNRMFASLAGHPGPLLGGVLLLPLMPLLLEHLRGPNRGLAFDANRLLVLGYALALVVRFPHSGPRTVVQALAVLLPLGLCGWSAAAGCRMNGRS